MKRIYNIDSIENTETKIKRNEESLLEKQIQEYLDAVQSTYQYNNSQKLNKFFTHISMKDFNNLIKLNTPLITELNLINLNILHKTNFECFLKDLYDSLKENTSITKINLSHNIIKKGIIYLSDILKLKTCSIKWLNLFNNGIEDGGMKYLSESLKVNNSIIIINLSFNNFKTQGIEYLSDALKENNSILNLYLELNSINKRGITYLSEALKINNSIMNIKLSFNDIYRNNGYDCLIELFKLNTSITKINLTDFININEEKNDIISGYVLRNLKKKIMKRNRLMNLFLILSKL